MADYTAGRDGEYLGVVRYGRDLFEKHEAIGTGSDIFPGQAVMTTTDADGNDAFTPHDGGNSDVYVALEARGRGMDAQTDTGYVADENYVKAVRAAGGGLNLRVAAGENIADGDPLVVQAGGNWGAFDGAGGDVDSDIAAYADEDRDLSGSPDPELVAADME